jgi:tetratricopeptide (TPR) repeat protein
MSMTMRYRTAVAALVVSAAVGTAGCGRYSLQSLKAQKAYKEANDLYRASDWKNAAAKYEYVLQLDPSRHEVYFFLGNSYDNAYKPARAGEPQNDAYMTKAIENYRKAAELDKNPEMKTLALQYLVAAFGSDKLNDPGQAEPILQELITKDSTNTANYFQLSKLYEDSGRYEDAEKALLKAREVKPNDPGVYTSIANYYNRQGEFDKTMEALHKAADLDPNNPQGHQLVAVYYYDKSSKDTRLSPAKKREYATKGLESSDRALALNADYSDALVYKGLLKRVLASVETDRNKQQQLIKEATEHQQRAIELNKKKTAGT